MTARKLGHVLIKPIFNAKECGNLGNTAANGRRIVAKAFKTKGKLVPYLVGHHLIFGRLHHKTDFLCLRSVVHRVKRHTAVQYFTLSSAVRGEAGFEVSQKCGLSASRRAAEDQKLAVLYRKRERTEGFFFHLRIGKAYIFEYIVFHFLSSVKFSTTGVMQSPK